MTRGGRPFYRFFVTRYFADGEIEPFGDYDSPKVPPLLSTITLRWLDDDGLSHWGKIAGKVRVVARSGMTLHCVPVGASQGLVRRVRKIAARG